jgi:hypothetical protein
MPFIMLFENHVQPECSQSEIFLKERTDGLNVFAQNSCAPASRNFLNKYENGGTMVNFVVLIKC